MQYRIKTIKTVINAWGNVHYINGNREFYVMVEKDHRHPDNNRLELVRGGFCKLHKYSTLEDLPKTVLDLVKTDI